MAKAKKAAVKTIAKSTKASSTVKKSKTVANPKKVSAVKASAPKKSVKAVPANKTTKATAKKAVPVKKATEVKNAKSVSKKAVPPKKSVQSVPAKQGTVKKAVSKTVVKQSVAKKAVPVKKVVKKAAAIQKDATSKAVKQTPVKKMPTSPKKSAVLNKEPKTEAKKAVSKNTATAKKAKVAAQKALAKSKKAKDALGALPVSNEIEDRIGRKSTVKQSKDGAVAIIDLNRNSKKSKSVKEESVEKFEPKIGSSILDPVENVGPAFRYSDEDLQEFKDIILKRLETARENLNYYQALMSRKDESGTDDTDNRFNSMEDGSGVMEREQLSQLAARQMQFIDHLEKAIMRIENKTYGVCRVTGKLIDKARLRAVPHATLSMEAKSNRR